DRGEETAGRGAVRAHRGAAVRVEGRAGHSPFEVALEAAGDAAAHGLPVALIRLARAGTDAADGDEDAVLKLFAHVERAVSVVPDLEEAVEHVLRPRLAARTVVGRAAVEGAELALLFETVFRRPLFRPVG